MLSWASPSLAGYDFVEASAQGAPVYRSASGWVLHRDRVPWKKATGRHWLGNHLKSLWNLRHWWVKRCWKLLKTTLVKKLWVLIDAPTVPPVFLCLSCQGGALRFCELFAPKISWPVSIPAADQHQFSGAGQLLVKLTIGRVVCWMVPKAGGVYEWFIIMICLGLSQNGWTQLLLKTDECV